MYQWSMGVLSKITKAPGKGWTKYRNSALNDDVWVPNNQKSAYERVANTLTRPVPPVKQKPTSSGSQWVLKSDKPTGSDSISTTNITNIPLPKVEETLVSEVVIKDSKQPVTSELSLILPKKEDERPPFDLGLVPDEILLNVLLYMDEAQLAKLRQVTKRFKLLAEISISRFIVSHATGYSSVIGSLATYMEQQIDMSSELLLSVDQITEASFMDQILGDDVTRHINMGRGSKRGDVERIKSNDVRVISLRSGKMHNKFWVLDNKVVVTGSPNLTFSAFTLNIESLVRLESRYVAACFRLYFELMRNYSREKAQRLQGMLNALNQSRSSFRLALSPYTDIQAFVLNVCQGASEIVIRMFLVSYFEFGGDVVEGLGKLAQKGTKIKVFVDEGQYLNARDKSGFYVQEAVEILKSSGIEVYTQRRSNNAIMHDKLILVKFDQLGGSSYRTIIGSAGFSQNVMNNNNYENLVSIDGFYLYDFFMTQHHEVTLKKKTEYITVKR